VSVSSRYCSAKEGVVFEGWVCETGKQEKPRRSRVAIA